MRYTAITVRSAQTLPHPTADFASTSSSVEISALLDGNDVLTVCVKKLQKQADSMVEQHLEQKRQRMHAAKPQQATESKAAELAAKHGRF